MPRPVCYVLGECRAEPGSPLYRAAVWWLLDNGALVPDREANARARNAAGAKHRAFAFRLTRRGLDMLREA